MADVEADMAGLSLNDHVEQAVKAFEIKQVWSNQQWVAAKAQEVEAATTGKERNKIRSALALGFGFESWPALKVEHNLSKPIDLLNLPTDIGQKCSGTSVPTLAADREDFLSKLLTGINQQYETEKYKFPHIPLPQDYAVLLSLTDGIRDNDLRASGVCGIDGIRGADLTKIVPQCVDMLPRGGFLWRFGWDLGTGFLLSYRTPTRKHWLVYYYCAKSEITISHGERVVPEEIQLEEREWKWRLFYKEAERPRLAFVSPMIFDGIVEWLEWYQEWWDRESRVYPEWYAENLRMVEILHGGDADQLGENGP